MRRMVGGFTLVELLVALTISSIVILATSAASSAVWRLWRRVEDRRPIEQQAGSVIDTMRMELAGLYLPSAEDGNVMGLKKVEDRNRGEQMISFCTTRVAYRRGFGSGRCAKVTYEYRKLPVSDGGAAPSGNGVLIRREQLMAGEKAIAEPTAEVIARGLISFAVECLKADGKQDASGGRDADRSPRMVRLRMAWAPRGSSAEAGRMVSYAAQFMVPVDGPLKEKDKEAGS